MLLLSIFFFFNDTATTEIYTLSLHDALPIWLERWMEETNDPILRGPVPAPVGAEINTRDQLSPNDPPDRKSTRLNSSHANISYAVFCLKKKNQINTQPHTDAINLTIVLTYER